MYFYVYQKNTISISGLSISEHFKEFMDQTTNHFMDAGFSTPGFFSLPVDISNYKKNGSKHGSVLIYVLIILVRNHPKKTWNERKFHQRPDCIMNDTPVGRQLP